MPANGVGKTSNINTQMNFRRISFLALLFSAFYSFGFAQFNVNQNFIVSPPASPNCYNEVVTSQDELWQGGFFTILQTHDIYSPTDPDLEKKMNLQAVRNVYYDVYHDTGNQLQYIKTVLFSANWLVADSLCWYRATDLVGVPEGNTVLKMRIDIIHSANSPHPVDLAIELNGQLSCSYANFENTTLACDFGQVDCFYYHPCGEVEVTGQANSCSGGGLSNAICYEFSASVPNGSGNYTYNWSATQQSGSWSSTNPVFMFQSSFAGHPVVTLNLTDNVTGCEYYFNTGGKNSFATDAQVENRLQVGPSPSLIGRELTVNYALVSKGKVTISLYDLQGREVQHVYEGTNETDGNHNLKFVPDVPAGTYLLSMRTANGLLTQKLILQE